MTHARPTVVTVTFNDLANLTRTVRSVLLQTSVEVEYIVVDGNSSDGTQDWLRLHAPMASVISEQDRGLFDAMNKGLGLTTGSLVTFLNAGDTYVRPTVLRDVVASYIEHRWRWSYGRARVVDERGRPVRPVVGLRRYALWKHAWNLNPICHQATYAETELLRDLGGFSLERENAADFDLMLRAAVHSQPWVLGTLDVDYLAGGVSEREAYRQLARKHSIRVDTLSLGRLGSSVDQALTAAQFAYLTAKRSAKRAAPQPVRRWWATRA